MDVARRSPGQVHDVVVGRARGAEGDLRDDALPLPGREVHAVDPDPVSAGGVGRGLLRLAGVEAGEVAAFEFAESVPEGGGWAGELDAAAGQYVAAVGEFEGLECMLFDDEDGDAGVRGGADGGPAGAGRRSVGGGWGWWSAGGGWRVREGSRARGAGGGGAAGPPAGTAASR